MPKQTTPAEIRYELRIINHCTVRVAGVDIKLEGSRDSGAIVRVVIANGLIVDQVVVALTTDVGALLNLREHIRQDGGLTLHRDL